MLQHENQFKKMDILAYFEISRKQLNLNQISKNEKSKLKSDIFRHMNFHELACLFAYMSAPELIQICTWLNRKARVAARYALYDNYNHK